MNSKILIAPVISMRHMPHTHGLPGVANIHDLGEDGVLYFCGEQGDTDEDGGHPQNVGNFPKFNKVLAWGRQNGNGWIRFTNDGDVIPDLPIFF